MADELKAVIYDAATGKLTEREFTKDEVAALKVMQAELDKSNAEIDAKSAAKESALAKLAKLGLTAEEIAAL
jgi:predicted DNA-binding transcriptional regulator YafY